jgi:methanogenic corrinoid protein MtbC1
MLDSLDELSDTTRRQILFSIRSGPKSVNEIVREIGVKQPNVSNHLQRLRNKKIVTASRQGRQVLYSLASNQIESILQAAVSVRQSDDQPADFTNLVLEYVRNAVLGDEERTMEILDEAFRINTALLKIYEGLLAPAMRKVGEWYYEGKIDEAQEHLATEITLRCMSKTVLVAGPAKRNGKRCVIGCPPNEWHAIGARMAADILRLSGWRTLFCGPNVPVRSFLSAVFQNAPNLVLVSCSTEESLEPASRLVRELFGLKRQPDDYSIGLGGNISHGGVQILRSSGADFVTNNLTQFAREIVPVIESGSRLSERLAWGQQPQP